jgi:glycosidase
MQFALQNIVDSHDTDRLASMIVNRPPDGEVYLQPDRFDYDVSPRVSPRHDNERRQYNVRRPNDRERRIQRMVVLLQMTYLGAPMIYYGDEAGMWGGDDPCNRSPMLWDDLRYEPQAAHPRGRPRRPDPVDFDRELHDFYRRAIALRRATDSLRRGSFAVVESRDAAQFFAFRRELAGKETLIGFNRGEDRFVWALDGAEQFDLVFTSDKDAEVIEQENGAPSIVLPALSAAVVTER